MKFFSSPTTENKYVRLTRFVDDKLLVVHERDIVSLQPNVVEWLDEHAPGHAMEVLNWAVFIDFNDNDAAFHFKMAFR